MSKPRNEHCPCSDRAMIYVDEKVTCPACYTAFCSPECGWANGHSDEGGHLCPLKPVMTITWVTLGDD